MNTEKVLLEVIRYIYVIYCNNTHILMLAAFLAQTISLDDNTTVKFEIW